jgi:hypothetical protein
MKIIYQGDPVIEKGLLLREELLLLPALSMRAGLCSIQLF